MVLDLAAHRHIELTRIFGLSLIVERNVEMVTRANRQTPVISRRFRDILSAILGELGGADRLSEGQRQLARRVALMSMKCETMEAKSVGGEQIDIDIYGQLSDRIGRACQRLGLKRLPKDVTPPICGLTSARARADDEHN